MLYQTTKYTVSPDDRPVTVTSGLEDEPHAAAGGAIAGLPSAGVHDGSPVTAAFVIQTDTDEVVELYASATSESQFEGRFGMLRLNAVDFFHEPPPSKLL